MSILQLIHVLRTYYLPVNLLTLYIRVDLSYNPFSLQTWKGTLGVRSRT